MHRVINYSQDGYFKYLIVDVTISDEAKIQEQAINKALMIAMNYILENLETTDQESAE